MASFNQVTLMGNLTRDPEMRSTSGGITVCKVGLAVNRRVKNQQTDQYEEEPVFIDVTIFGKRAEAFGQFHSKGSPAFFSGELRFDQWEDKETGQKRSKLYVVANNWEFVGGKSDRAQGGGTAQPAISGGYGQASSSDFLGGDDAPF